MNRRVSVSLCLAAAVLIFGVAAVNARDDKKKDKKKEAAAPRPPATPWLAKSQPITTRSGLQYWDIEPGEGFEAVRGKKVKVHYSGYLKTGQKFDSSVDRNRPLEFRVGNGDVILGWEEGVVGMRIGGKRKLRIPPHLAYGDAGAGNGAIPPRSTLTFDIELLEVR